MRSNKSLITGAFSAINRRWRNPKNVDSETVNMFVDKAYFAVFNDKDRPDNLSIGIAVENGKPEIVILASKKIAELTFGRQENTENYLYIWNGLGRDKRTQIIMKMCLLSHTIKIDTDRRKKALQELSEIKKTLNETEYLNNE